MKSKVFYLDRPRKYYCHALRGITRLSSRFAAGSDGQSKRVRIGCKGRRVIIPGTSLTNTKKRRMHRTLPSGILAVMRLPSTVHSRSEGSFSQTPIDHANITDWEKNLQKALVPNMVESLIDIEKYHGRLFTLTASFRQGFSQPHQ